MSATPASMLHIVTSGLQDRERLNSPNPTVQFYKTVMRRRTRWASQWRRVEFDNLADFGRTAVVTLPIQGELITRATLVINLPDIYTPQVEARTANPAIVGPSWAWTNSIGHAICSDVQMLIGDQIIDQFDSRALEILDELTTPIEHYDSTNSLIARDPSSFSDQELLQIGQNKPSAQSTNQTLNIVFPFWWNRGPGPQALPIQALWKDKVQLKVTFRPVQQCVYTSTRVDSRNPPLSANQGPGPMPNIAGCGFFAADSSGTPIYNAASTDLLPSNPFTGSVTGAMPSAYHFLDAYWIVEYVSLENREAAAYRLADLEIPIEQHVALPVIETGGAESVRIRLEKGGLVRDLTWVAQRTEATDYNAYFLFSKELGPAPSPPPLVDASGNPTEPVPVQNPCDIPWWPNAVVPDWNYGNGYIRPAFADRNSDPILSAALHIRGLTRFDHEAPSVFRSLIPLHNCKCSPLINRYIYRYDFGFWSTGGLAEAADLPVDEIRGYSNWDKLPKRELALTMNQAPYGEQQWAIDGDPIHFSVGAIPTRAVITIPQRTEGLMLILRGAQPTATAFYSNNGNGATVAGIIDYTLLRQYPNFVGIYPRVIPNGSSSLVMKLRSNEYVYLAVAGAGGFGNRQSPRYGAAFTNKFGPTIPVFGGNAGSAIEVGWQGANNTKTTTYLTDENGSDIIYRATASTGAITDPMSTITFAEGYTISSKPIIVLFNCYIETLSFVMNNLNTPVTVDFLTDTSGIIYTRDLPRQPTLASRVTYSFTVNPVPSTTTQIYIQIPFLNLKITDVFTVKITATTLAKIYSYQVAEYQDYLACILETKYQFTPQVSLDVSGTGFTSLFGGGGLGQPDGAQMTTDATFVQSTTTTGGQGDYSPGGDGYYGGGSGFFGGGGGGSFVSPFVTYVNTFESGPSVSSATFVPLKRVHPSPPSYNIYSWVTRYNRLRINSGRGALMFNEAS